jgi:hypothetical protein
MQSRLELERLVVAIREATSIAWRRGVGASFPLLVALVLAGVAAAESGPAVDSPGVAAQASMPSTVVPETHVIASVPAAVPVALPHVSTQRASAAASQRAVLSPDPDVGLSSSGSKDLWGGASLASVETFDYEALPGRLSDASLRNQWALGLTQEREEKLLESARVYELIVSEVPDQSYTYWRIARNYWRHGEGLPVEAKEERVRFFELSEDWAGRGISIDPECAPCMLWKFVSMGRQATTKGLLTAARDVKEMDHLLTRGIELKPDHTDDVGNATLGNLYYAGAVFYRVVPDWFWLRWVLGARGDKERSIEYAKRAVEIAEMRVDYRVELGATLLCLGTAKNDADSIREGTAVLEAALGLDDYLSTDYLDKEHAMVLVESPEKACGYSRDGFIDLEAMIEEGDVKP